MSIDKPGGKLPDRIHLNNKPLTTEEISQLDQQRATQRKEFQSAVDADSRQFQNTNFYQDMMSEKGRWEFEKLQKPMQKRETSVKKTQVARLGTILRMGKKAVEWVRGVVSQREKARKAIRKLKGTDHRKIKEIISNPILKKKFIKMQSLAKKIEQGNSTPKVVKRLLEISDELRLSHFKERHLNRNIVRNRALKVDDDFSGFYKDKLDDLYKEISQFFNKNMSKLKEVKKTGDKGMELKFDSHIPLGYVMRKGGNGKLLTFENARKVVISLKQDRNGSFFIKTIYLNK